VTSLDEPLTASRPRSDAELFQASVRRPEVLAEVFDRHAPDLLRYLARRIGPHDAEDLLGDVFVVALERRGSFDASAASARPWLYGIASNLLHRRRRDEVRSWRALARVGDDAGVAIFDEEVEARLDSTGAVRGLAGALAELSAGDRDVLLMVAWAELTHDEIATSLDIPVGTVKSRLHRARRVLRAHLPNVKDDE
jgi:RNA polymerase sigma factor (sigma-70 family)